MKLGMSLATSDEIIDGISDGTSLEYLIELLMVYIREISIGTNLEVPDGTGLGTSDGINDGVSLGACLIKYNTCYVAGGI